MPSKPCTECARATPIFLEGRCHACHVKLVAEGVLPSTSIMPRQCPVDGCSGYVVKRGLCDRHYRRVVDHGSVEKVRREGKAPEREHPYYKNFIYLRGHGKLCPEWHDFQVFWNDAGDRPSDRHRLARPDTSKPYGPTNFMWKAPLFEERHASFATKEGRAEYDRKYQRFVRAHNPDYWAHSQRKRNYGLTAEQYDAMVDAQHGLCAMCSCPETKHARNGRLLPLSVDHDHVTGAIRGLLCGACNAMLGYADDSADRLRAAIAYLERYAAVPALICDTPTGPPN